jgi:hypothetical protein
MGSGIDRNDPFWPLLVEGFPGPQREIAKEETTDEVIQPVISLGSGMVTPLLVEDIAAIMPKDASGKQESRWIPHI